MPWSEERKAKWLASVKQSNKKPARSGPASGAGWGGEAQGPGDGSPKREHFAEGNEVARIKDENERDRRRTRKQQLEERADKYLDLMDDIATNEHEPSKLRLEAMVHARNQILGTPVSRQVIAGDPTSPPAFVIFGEREATDSESWQATHAPSK